MILRQKNCTVELHDFSSIDKDLIAAQYLGWLNDPEVTFQIASPVFSEKKDISFIDESYMRFTQKHCRGFFIRDLNDGKFVGTAKVDRIDLDFKSAEIGIMIGEKDRWGRGIATQSFSLLMSYVFNDLKLHRVWGGTNAQNFAMQNVFTKLGFSQEAILRDSCVLNGEYVNSYLYSMLEDEYRIKIKR